MENEQSHLIRQLDALLDSERAALLDGNLRLLAELVVEKEQILDALAELEIVNSEPLQPVNSKVARNQVLLEKAMEGIRSAAARLSDMRQNRKAFDTYNHMGQKNRIEPETKPSVEKRA